MALSIDLASPSSGQASVCTLLSEPQWSALISTYDELPAGGCMFSLCVTKRGSLFLETTMALPKKVGINTGVTSVISEVESISSVTEEQRTALRAFLD